VPADCNPNNDTDKERVSQLLITLQYQAVNQIISNYVKMGPSIQTVGMIVNGDLTAYGHEYQLNMYKKLLSNYFEHPYYLGLGNHDYANNINDCTDNNCASRMVDFMYDFLKNTKTITQKDYTCSELECTGSLAYTFTFGPNYRVVQLHNFPFWTTHFKKDLFFQYNITASFELLKVLLSNSMKAQERVLITMHDYDDTSDSNHWSAADVAQFNQLVGSYSSTICGVFAGHFHGNWGPNMPGINGVPMFWSGSATYRRFLELEFNPDAHTMKVSGVTNSYPTPNPATYQYTTGSPFNTGLNGSNIWKC